MTFLYKADPIRGAQWAELFARKMPELPFRIWPDIGDPHEVRYLAAWQPPEDLAARFPNLEVLSSMMLTPYIASMTQPETAVEAVLDNLRRHREGLPMIGLVDRARGY
jgi:phosphoglycerate dehydrogenase-like enzyme